MTVILIMMTKSSSRFPGGITDIMKSLETANKSVQDNADSAALQSRT